MMPLEKIEAGMFMDKTGNINPAFANQYRQIQQGYAKDVIPYTKNKMLNEYRRGERLPDQVVKSLSSGKFPAQRGQYHKALMLRRALAKHPVLSNITGLGGTGALAFLLYKALSGEHPQGE